MSSLNAFAQSEARARQAEARIDNENNQEAALASTISAVELYMKALKLADNASEWKRIDGKCKELLSRAESMKKSRHKAGTIQNTSSTVTPHSSRPGPPISTRELSTREKIILLEGAKLNGFVFKAWESPPSHDEFVLHDSQDLFSDDPVLSLSELQLESFAGWKRPNEALASLALADGENETTTPTMEKGSAKIDLVQDLTSDCSVVASLCAGTARAERGHSKVIPQMYLKVQFNDMIAATIDNVSLRLQRASSLHF
jgi:calpain-7